MVDALTGKRAMTLAEPTLYFYAIKVSELFLLPVFLGCIYRCFGDRGRATESFVRVGGLNGRERDAKTVR